MRRTTNLLRKCRDDLLRRGTCSIEDVIRYAKRHHAAELAEERERLLELALRREVKELMREATGEDRDSRSAMTALLPGLDAPLAIAVPTEVGGYRYVPFHAATWDDLLKARAERAANHARAGERLRDFDRKLEILKPYMEGSNNVTVAAACEMMAKSVA